MTELKHGGHRKRQKRLASCPRFNHVVMLNILPSRCYFIFFERYFGTLLTTEWSTFRPLL